MRNSGKLDLRVIGMTLLSVLSLTAVFAFSAQAQLPGESKVGEFQIDLDPALSAFVHGTQESAGRLLVPGKNLTIECKTGLSANGQIFNSAEALATVLFSECSVWNLLQTVPLACLVLSPGEAGDSVSAKALALPVLHGPDDISYVLFEPDNQLNLTEIELHGATCPLSLVSPVKGSVAAEVIFNDDWEPLLAFSRAIQELTGDKLTFGGFPAFIDGNAIAELTGSHIGKLGVV